MLKRLNQNHKKQQNNKKLNFLKFLGCAKCEIVDLFIRDETK